MFYESFKSNVHENQQLNDSQRVQYLVGRLTNNALRVTAGIVPTGDTYRDIWNSLVKKFQDKRALGTHYINNILDMKACNNTVNSLDAFIEKYSASIAALKQLDIHDLADFILFHCGLRKIDTQTVQAFELSVRSKEIPTYHDLISFVQDQVKILERSNNQSSHSNSRAFNSSNVPSATTTKYPGTFSKTFIANDVLTHAALSCCVYCNKPEHTQLYNCPQFKSLGTPQMKFDVIKSKRGCVNCLGMSHTVSNCNSSSVCKICEKRHHTLLHFEKGNTLARAHTAQICRCQSSAPPRSSNERVAAAVSSTPGIEESNPRSVHNTSNNTSPNNNASLSLCSKLKPNANVLLSTAQVYATSRNAKNNKINIRSLIDNGSQNNLISVDCCRKLNLTINTLNDSYVSGVGSSSRPIHGYVNVEIQSRVYPNNKYNIQALVVDTITDQLPTHFIEKHNMTHLDGLPLADPTWNIPGNIDLLLGAQLFPYIYLGNRVESGSRAPPALLSVFGYVLMGDYPNADTIQASFSALAIHHIEQKSCKLEEISFEQSLFPQGTECENTSSVNKVDEIERSNTLFRYLPVGKSMSRVILVPVLIANSWPLRESWKLNLLFR
ncbi:hypothetical protein ABMA28_004442 [Loxostege sticticalis]|uniref:Peptidase aspartic putative domain-containing protein n=1 Tax=Loxostege sticticalis TaxID=481309 RepID=A0ABD0SR63_LOXSC